MQVTAVFTCTRKEAVGDGMQCEFTPPCQIDLKPGESLEGKTGKAWAEYHAERFKRVNQDWSTYTPSGQLSMYITNPIAHAEFVKGETYLLTFERFGQAETP